MGETAQNLSMKNKPAAKPGPQTLAIHGGEPKRHGVNAGVGTEISRTSNFTFASTQQMKEWAEGKNKAPRDLAAAAQLHPSDRRGVPLTLAR